MQQPLDQHSANPDITGADCARYVDYTATALREVGPPLPLDRVDISDYAAVVLPGGHRPVVDLRQDPILGRLLIRADEAGAVIGAVCHGPAALLSAIDSEGRWRFAHRRMAAFTDEEERRFGTAEGAPWLLASRLREWGANHEGDPAFEPYNVRDGNLFTGQNPTSSGPMATDMIDALHWTRPTAAPACRSRRQQTRFGGRSPPGTAGPRA